MDTVLDFLMCWRAAASDLSWRPCSPFQGSKKRREKKRSVNNLRKWNRNKTSQKQKQQQQQQKQTHSLPKAQVMKEDLSTLIEASLPVRPKSTLFMWAEKGAAVYMSPLLLCDETKTNIEKEKRSTMASHGVNGVQKTSQLSCFQKNH